jgi:N utilization substance protein B
MGKRSTARRLAMQLIFQLDSGGQLTDEQKEYFLKNEAATASAKNTARLLVSGLESHLAEIDRLIKKHSQNWPLERISRTDLAILRLAFYELAFLKETPEKVIINEALELSKRFSTEDSFAFINGVLDGYIKGK